MYNKKKARNKASNLRNSKSLRFLTEIQNIEPIVTYMRKPYRTADLKSTRKEINQVRYVKIINPKIFERLALILTARGNERRDIRNRFINQSQIM